MNDRERRPEVEERDEQPQADPIDRILRGGSRHELAAFVIKLPDGRLARPYQGADGGCRGCGACRCGRPATKVREEIE